MKIHQEKHKKGKINQSKPGVCAVLFILWFVFGVLVLFLVFLFVFWVSSFLFFCLQCFCIFLDLTIFQKCCVFQNHFSLQRASKQIPGSIQSWDRKKNRSKMYERKGGQPHPSLEYMSGFDMLRLQACLEIVGSGWTHTITHLIPFVCPFLQLSNKNALYTRLFQSGEKTGQNV